VREPRAAKDKKTERATSIGRNLLESERKSKKRGRNLGGEQKRGVTETGKKFDKKSRKGGG